MGGRWRGMRVQGSYLPAEGGRGCLYASGNNPVKKEGCPPATEHS